MDRLESVTTDGIPRRGFLKGRGCRRARRPGVKTVEDRMNAIDYRAEGQLFD